MTFKKMLLSGCAVAGAAVFLTAAAHAQTSSTITGQMNSLQQQIQQLQQQLQQLQGQVKQAQDQAQQSQQAAKKVADEQAKMPKVTMSPSGRPGWASADGRNSIELTSRLHFDAGDYLSVKRPNQLTASQADLNSGVNARRARIGILGKFMGDWNYGLIFDAGGTSDSYTATGAPASPIENAYITYNGFYHGDYPVAVDLGYIDVPWTLDEATSSNDIMFLERSSSQVVATQFGGGDARAAFGFRSNDQRYWAAAYLTGPTAGSTHTGSAFEQTAALGRVTYQVLQDPDYSLHIGVNGADMIHPPGNGSTTQTLTLSDRPELRIDPATFLTTGAMNANHGYVAGGELAAAYENAFFQGEYYHYWVDQYNTPSTAAVPTPTLQFNGGYAQASYSFGGRRKYLPGTGAYSGVIPEHPLAMSLDGFSGGWGALELAARYSYVNLNSHVTSGLSQASTGGVYGGDQHTETVGLNWYVNNNIRFMLDYLHATVNKLASNGTTQGGVKIDALALRSQVAF